MSAVIRTTCKSLGGVYAVCGRCDTALIGTSYPLDLEGVNDWMREHYLIEHATTQELLTAALDSVRRSKALRAANWGAYLADRP